MLLRRPGWLSRYSDSLRAGWPGDRIPVGARFSAPNENRVISGSKATAAWRWTPTPTNGKVKGRVKLNLYSPCGPWWPVLGWTVPVQAECTCTGWMYLYNTELYLYNTSLYLSKRLTVGHRYIVSGQIYKNYHLNVDISLFTTDHTS
jgi:hypothetical protein